jgi:hypothetical protein
MKAIRTLSSLPIIFLLLSGVVADPLSAAVIERDWKTPGDGLLTYDTVNKREWLDLSQTILDDRFPGTGADFLAIRESRYQYVVEQTGPDGLFEGFTVAKSSDAIFLAQSAGIDTSTDDYVKNMDATLALGELLSFAFNYLPSGGAEAAGLLNETVSIPFEYRAAALFRVSPGNSADLLIGSANQYITFPPGVMLYRVIPEPTSYLLILMCLGTLTCCDGFARLYLH